MKVLKRFRLLYLAPVLAMVTLTGWALASPIGASPDDDFHLVSIWCGDGLRDGICEPGTTTANRMVPEALKDASVCYAHRPDVGAACQAKEFDLDPDPSVVTDRGNFLGAYPPVYYAVMGMFVTPDILFSAVLMRILNALLFVALVTGLFVLLPRERRPALVWGWLVTTVPLGLFLIASNNPSSWAITGVGIAWIALLGYFETEGRRRIALGSVFVAATIMAAGSRGDSALYVGLAILLVLGLKFRRDWRFALAAILPIVMGVVAGLLFLTAQQSQSGLNGFGGSGGTMSETSGPGGGDPLSLIVANLLNIPSLWAGVLGYWALGWFDTAMPAVVTFGSIACFVVVVFAGLAMMWRRKAIALTVVGTVLIALPTWVLFRGGDSVGQEVQPRYLLPLIVVFAGLAVLGLGARNVRFTLTQRVLIVGTLSFAQLIALYVNLRRYIQGDGGGGWNLDVDPGWWWSIAVSPMSVLAVGSLAFAALAWILVKEVSVQRVADPPTSTVVV